MPSSTRPIDRSSEITFDPSTSDLEAADVQAALEELADLVAAVETTPGPAGPAGPSGVVAATPPLSFAAGTIALDEAGLVHRTGVETIAGAKTFTDAMVVQAPAAATKALVVKGAASQSASLQEWQDSAGAVLASLSPNATVLTMPTRFAIGYLATASGSQAIAMGVAATVAGNNGVAIGANAVASQLSTVAIGISSSASATSAVALGNGAVCDQAGAAAVGGALVMGTDEFAFGTKRALNLATGLRLTGYTSTTPRSLFHLKTTFVDSTDATFKVRATLSVNDWAATTTGREGLRVESDGTAARLGFLGSTAQAKPTVSGSRAGNAALAALLTALANYGLIVDGTSA